MKSRKFKLLQRVVLSVDRHLTVRRQSRGRVIRQDTSRGEYDTEVLWYHKLSGRHRRTWVPSHFLEPS